MSFLAVLVAVLCFCIETGVESRSFYGNVTLVEEAPLMERNAILRDDRLWPNGVVIYEFTSLRTYRKLIKKVMVHIEDNTCIRFQERKNEKGYVNIYNGKLFTCFADVGYFPNARHRLSLGLGCRAFGSILHEMGHVLGLYHEHQRPDRDNYVTVFDENIQDGAQKDFKKRKPEQTKVIGPFDYDSIMIYGENDAKKSFSAGTLKAKKEGVTLLNPAQKNALSPLDIKKLNTLYNCPGKDKF